MIVQRSKYFVEVSDWEPSDKSDCGTKKLIGRMILANDSSTVSFQRSPMSYKCKARPGKPVEKMTDSELEDFYRIAAQEHDEEFRLLAESMKKRKGE